ncbi:MFS transporter [Phenylobacterium sp. J367]|uniref:MFS transporter n=1 Tax=Phenylobacterium sp. J367 TaxID=2898435 RepID=UPI0021511E41|nr:MFS transporter [Phenylobacterium sp. J367]MCR5880744.1 MFS transporter [Phenylobacterium sp. J367]
MSQVEDGPAGRGRRAAVGFILVSVWLDVLSLGVVIPVFAPLIQEFEGGDAAAAGRFIGLFATVWALSQFFAAPVLGALSDRFGRRPVLLISLFGLALDYLLMAFAPSLGWLFVGRVVSGLTAAGMAVASAYIADVTPPEKRAGTFGLIGAAWGVGFIVGPAIGGFLGDISLRLPFLAAAGLTMLGALYGFFLLPESLKPENRSPFAWAKANPLGSLGFLASHRELLGLSSLNFLLQLAHNVLPTIFVLYASNRYGWTLAQTGAALALTGVCNIVVQGLLVKPIVARIGEWGAVLLGLAAGGLGFVIYGLAPHRRLVPGGDACVWPDRLFRPRLPGPDHPPRLGQGAGPAAGRQRQPHGTVRRDRPAGVRPDLRLVRRARPSLRARGRIPAGRGSARARRHHRCRPSCAASPDRRSGRLNFARGPHGRSQAPRGPASKKGDRAAKPPSASSSPAR